MKREKKSNTAPSDEALGMATDLGGASKLAIDAVTGVTNIVEALHRNISGLAPIVGAQRKGRTSGITGFVYSSVRGVTNVVGFGLDAAFAQLAPLLKGRGEIAQRAAVLAAVNGVFGDYLAATNNSLAINLQLRQKGKLLMTKTQTGSKLLVLVHGLCMNDLQWTREGHDHGAALAKDLGYTPIYLHYNSGRHISTNGREFANTLEGLMNEWPVDVSELVIAGHSMGGLVTRSACHYAKLAKHTWPRRLNKLVFLGTPHHGAPLERAGNWVDILLSISPYSAPLARIGKIRSAGVKDLRYGNLLDDDWAGKTTARTHDEGQAVPLPSRVKCFVMAATKQAQTQTHTQKNGEAKRLQSDALVPVNSALGINTHNAALTLKIPKAHQHIAFATDHFQLLSSREVYKQLAQWLK